MCPCISSRDKHAICNKSGAGLVCPSLSERENFCFSLYELCPIFLGANIYCGETGNKTDGIEDEDLVYV